MKPQSELLWALMDKRGNLRRHVLRRRGRVVTYLTQRTACMFACTNETPVRVRVTYEVVEKGRKR